MGLDEYWVTPICFFWIYLAQIGPYGTRSANGGERIRGAGEQVGRACSRSQFTIWFKTKNNRNKISQAVAPMMYGLT